MASTDAKLQDEDLDDTISTFMLNTSYLTLVALI